MVTYCSIVRWSPGVSKDLEERRRAISSASIRNFAQVCVNWSPVRAADSRRLEGRQGARAVSSLLVHFNRHSVASFDGTSAGYGAAVDVASNAVGRDIGQRAVGLRHAHAGFSLVDAVDPEVLERCVGGDARGG